MAPWNMFRNGGKRNFDEALTSHEACCKGIVSKGSLWAFSIVCSGGQVYDFEGARTVEDLKA